MGHKAAIASLDALTHPVTDLRRRR